MHQLRSNSLHLPRNAKFLALSVTAALSLPGCGGGGGASNTPAATTPAAEAPTYLSVSGVVAYGSGAAGAEVTLRDMEGEIDNTITDASAGFMFPLASVKRKLTPPFAIEAKFKIGSGTEVKLYSISQAKKGGDVTMNATPVTDVIARINIAPDGGDPSMVSLEDSIPNNPSRLANITQRTKELFGSMANDVGDFVSTKFQSIPKIYAHDALLERLKIKVLQDRIRITTANGRVIAERLLSTLRTDRAGANDDTITDVEAAQAEADKGALPEGLQIETNALPLAITDHLVFAANSPLTGVLQGINVESFEITSRPSQGAITFDRETGRFTYIPEIGWTGTDEFQFSVRNMHGVSKPVTVRLTISDGCESRSSSGVYSTSCRYSIKEPIKIIAPAMGYPFSVSPEFFQTLEDLDDDEDTPNVPMLLRYWERSQLGTNISGTAGIDLSQHTLHHDTSLDRYSVTSSSGFYHRTTGVRIPLHASPFQRAQATYARHPNGNDYVLTGYTVAAIGLERPYPSYEPYELGRITSYALKGYDADGRPLYEGSEVVCIPEGYDISTQSILMETKRIWSASGTATTTKTPLNRCTTTLDQLRSVANEIRPSNLRHQWN